MIFSKYVCAQGSSYQKFADLPLDGDSNPYVLVIEDGIYRYTGSKWKRVHPESSVLFYETTKKIFYEISPLPNKEEKIVEGTPGIPAKDGDILLDGHHGQLYVYVKGKWFADPKCCLTLSWKDNSPILETTSNLAIPVSVSTVLANTNSKSLILTLPKADFSVYRTSIGSISESPKITVINTGHREAKVRPQENDKLFDKKYATLDKGRRATYQAHNGVWYVVST